MATLGDLSSGVIFAPSALNSSMLSRCVSSVPLVVQEPVGLAGFFGRAWDSIRLWIK